MPCIVATDRLAIVPVGLCPRVPLSPASVRSLRIGALSHDAIRAQTHSSLEVFFRPPTAISDQSPSLRTTSLDDWYGGLAVSSRLLVAQHLLAVSVDHRTKWLLSHAFNSLRNALTSNQVGGIEALGEIAESGCEQFTGAWLHILPI